MATIEEKREQIRSQCRVIIHLACNLAKLHADLSNLYTQEKNPEDFLDFVGRDTAARMDALGDMISNMDAVTEADKWTDGIFERAREFWPAPSPTP